MILTVSDAYGNSKNLPFTIGVASFGLTWNLDEMAYHKDEAVTIRLAPTGTGDKTAKIVAFLTPELTVPQYGTAAVKFMVVDPANETTSVELRANGTTVSVLSDVGRTVNTWAYKAKTVGTETLAVVCGTVAVTVTLTVTDLGYQIAPITSGLVLDIDPSGHSNSEAGRANFGYTDKSGVNHPFTFSDNFDWTGGGFQLDEDGVTAFVVKRGTYVTADCSLFSDNAKTNGKEIKLIFKATNVRNYDAELINCMSGNVGIKVQAQKATVGSEAETINVRYCEGKKIEMDVNIQASNENSLAYVRMKAVPSAKLHMSTRTIIDLENCKSNPRFETIVYIAQELDISLDALLFPNTASATVPKSVSDDFSGMSESEVQKYIVLCQHADTFRSEKVAATV